jgi:hypothetical protein
MRKAILQIDPHLPVVGMAHNRFMVATLPRADRAQSKVKPHDGASEGD